ncbi:MAG: hypothetical protein JO189_07300 [Deltaproteobacteria bacterium]|nr:hypothetical protein [Deltaproteobacteria bacterium]
MPTKSLGLAAIALACSTSIAAAQQAAPTPGELAALLHPGVTLGGGRLSTGAAGNAANAASVSTGWNYQHCYTAVWYSSGISTYVIAYNVEGTYFYAPWSGGAYAGAANTLLQVCGTGQQYGVYVTETSSLAFSDILTK